MLELRIQVDDIDYENAAEGLIPLLAEQLSKENSNPLIKAFASSQGAVTGAAKAMLKVLTQKQKDELVIKCFNSNKAKLIDLAETEAAKNNVKIRILGAQLERK